MTLDFLMCVYAEQTSDVHTELEHHFFSHENTQSNISLPPSFSFMKAKKFLHVTAAASDIASEEGRRKKATGFIYIRLSKSILFKQKAKKAFPLLAGKWGTNILSCFSRTPCQVKASSQSQLIFIFCASKYK